MDDLTPLMKDVIRMIILDPFLSSPYFCDHLRDEPTGNTKMNLPLIYIWYNYSMGKSLVISVNGGILTSILERFINRTEQEFIETRNVILEFLTCSSTLSIIEFCNEMNLPPEKLYLSHSDYLQDPRSALYITKPLDKRPPGWLRAKMESSKI
jgi:hypothetical protein